MNLDARAEDGIFATIADCRYDLVRHDLTKRHRD
jgi:hypothetical protein